jgi:hypothetical protein
VNCVTEDHGFGRGPLSWSGEVPLSPSPGEPMGLRKEVIQVSTHYVVSTSAALDPETSVEGVFTSIGEAVQSASSSVSNARVTRVAPKYIYQVDITPKMVVRQDVSVVTEEVSEAL